MSKIQVWTNGVQLSDWVENIAGKGEIARRLPTFPQASENIDQNVMV